MDKTLKILSPYRIQISEPNMHVCVYIAMFHAARSVEDQYWMPVGLGLTNLMIPITSSCLSIYHFISLHNKVLLITHIYSLVHGSWCIGKYWGHLCAASICRTWPHLSFPYSLALNNTIFEQHILQIVQKQAIFLGLFKDTLLHKFPHRLIDEVCGYKNWILFILL